ncbi:hypothetical protein G3A_10360 [Bacillus sp. 17376]|nr:hypothetical protein G3A_10360 [Bacillus sp. 17376]
MRSLLIILEMMGLLVIWMLAFFEGEFFGVYWPLRCFPFTQMRELVHYGAMQTCCFYPNAGVDSFSGNADVLLLPKC